MCGKRLRVMTYVLDGRDPVDAKKYAGSETPFSSCCWRTWRTVFYVLLFTRVRAFVVLLFAPSGGALSSLVVSPFSSCSCLVLLPAPWAAPLSTLTLGLTRARVRHPFVALPGEAWVSLWDSSLLPLLPLHCKGLVLGWSSRYYFAHSSFPSSSHTHYTHNRPYLRCGLLGSCLGFLLLAGRHAAFRLDTHHRV